MPSDELHPIRVGSFFSTDHWFSAERLNQLADRAEGDGLENVEDGGLEEERNKRKGRWKRVSLTNQPGR